MIAVILSLHQFGTGDAPDSFGSAVCGLLSDIDGDGIPDFAIGSPTEGNGVVRVVSGKEGVTITTIRDEGSRLFGTTLAGPGDLDGDGKPDLLVGASGDKDAPGAVFAYKPSGELLLRAKTDPEFPLYERDGLLCGAAICGAGDVDGDGFTDIAVALKSARGRNDTGKVMVYSVVSKLQIASYGGSVTLGGFGSSLAYLGDLESDGCPDLAVGCVPRLLEDGSGRVVLLSLRTGQVVREISGELGSNSFGVSVVSIADLDKDGCRDIAVGSPRHPWRTNQEELSADYPSVRAFSSQTGLQLREWRIRGNHASYGSLVTCVPDFNADGVEDILVTAPHNTSTRAWLCSGSEDATLLEFCGDAMWDARFGVSAACIGDTNGDAVADLAIGAADALAWPGNVKVYSGVSGKALRELYRKDVDSKSDR